MKLIDFYAAWCQPCKMMEPIVEELAQEGYNIEKVDVDKNQALAETYGVMSIPTFVIENDTKEVKRFTGVTSKEVLKQALN